MLQKHFNTQEEAMDRWPFWMFEENIKLVNEIMEEEEKTRKKEEGEQSKGLGNYSPDSMMRSANNMTSNFSMPKF